MAVFEAGHLLVILYNQIDTHLHWQGRATTPSCARINHHFAGSSWWLRATVLLFPRPNDLARFCRLLSDVSARIPRARRDDSS
jgi:hypothetical protein